MEFYAYFSIYFIFPSTLKITAVLFDNIASVGWVGVVSLFLWFALIFAEKKKILEAKIFFLIFIRISVFDILKLFCLKTHLRCYNVQV